MFLPIRILIVLMAVAFVLNLDAQQLRSRNNICSSPPLPPYFQPVDETALLSSRSANNYKIPFDTIRFNSTLGTKGFDIVICIDGVINNSQIDVADNYIDSLVARLQTVEHYQKRFKYFNIYRLAKLSNEEGSSWGFNGDTSVDNRYGSRYNAFNLDRLLIPEKVDTLFSDVNEFVPEYDLVLMLAFDKKYGGSGWSLYDGRKVASSGIDLETGWHLSDEVFIHEMQHIMPFAGHGYLGDEYEDSISCAIYDSIPESPNFTDDTINKRKWQHCMYLPSIGFYPEAGICTGNFRPSPNCAMRQVYNLPTFCPVCRENSTAYFDSVINPIYSASSLPGSFTGSYSFEAAVDTPLENTFRYEWFFDDSVITEGVNSLTLNFDSVDKNTNHTLKFICTDTDYHIIDTLLRRPWIVQWDLLTKDTIVTLPLIKGKPTVTVFPNPVGYFLHGIANGNKENISMYITAPDGKLLLEKTLITEGKFDFDVSALQSGIYFLLTRQSEKENVLKLLKY